MDLSLIKVTKSFGKQRVLNNINYNFKSNNVYFIVGESGCGKSTLIKIIANIISDYKGKVLINGKNIKEIKDDYLKQHIITYIDQSSPLINYLTINENIDFLLNKQIDKRYSKKFTNYSGGEKKRISTYVSSLKDSEIILADEISSSLDKQNALEIMNYLRTIAKNKILIVVTHDKFLINDNDIVINLRNIEQRRPIITSKFKYKRYKKAKNNKRIFKYAFKKLLDKYKYIFSFVSSFMVGLTLILLITSLKTGIMSFLNKELLKNFNFEYLLIESKDELSYGFEDNFDDISHEGILLLDDVRFDPVKNMIYINSNELTIYFELDKYYSMSKELYLENAMDYNININGFNCYINTIIDERDTIIHCPPSFFQYYYRFKGYNLNNYNSYNAVIRVEKDYLINNFLKLKNKYTNIKFINSGLEAYLYMNNLLKKVKIMLIVFISVSLLVTFFLVLTIMKLEINDDKKEIEFMKHSGLSDKFIFNFYYLTNLYRGLITFILTILFYSLVISLSNTMLKKQLNIDYNIMSISVSYIILIFAIVIIFVSLSMFLCKKRLLLMKN